LRNAPYALVVTPVNPLDFAFLKDRYDFELQRKEQLNTALALPVGVLGGLGGLRIK
jgi:hypothetical protein